MISLVRVDNRLIHGQVVEAWLPALKIARVVVADDEAAASPLIRAAMGLAVHASIDVSIQPLLQVPYRGVAADTLRTLVLVRDIDSVMRARTSGLLVAHLNLGNIHFAQGRRQVSPSVFLSQHELNALKELVVGGVNVEARAVPSDKPVSVETMAERFERSGK